MNKSYRMLSVITFIGCILMLQTGYSGQLQDTSGTRPYTVGTTFEFHSNVCGNDRTVMVGLPAGYEKSQKRYPVFFAVDGQWLFNISNEAVCGLSDNGIIPQMIVVGIHTEERRSFYLLPAADPVSHTVGADSLLAFIRDELIPFIDTHYRTMPRRILAGTSFGGVFVMHTLLTEPDLFDAIIAMSPAMWWNDGIMLKRTYEFMKERRELRKALFVTVANEGEAMGVDMLSEILKQCAPQGLAWRFDKHLDEIHGTIAYKSLYDGMKFTFSDWRPSPVRIETSGDLLDPGDAVTISLTGNSREIRYTLDGSEPSVQSALYEKPITVKEPATLKATPVFGLGMPGNTDSVVVGFVPKLKAEAQPPTLVPGLRYEYAEGRWDSLPDPRTITPVKTGVASNFEMTERTRDAQFAMRYTGYLEVKESSVIQFALTSDDGSRLTIGDRVVVENDGLHGMVEKRGKVYLEKGLHRIEVFFFQNDGGFGLNLEYQSASILRQKIPFTAFSCPAVAGK